MTLQGTVMNGVVVLDNGQKLADGTRVEVVTLNAAEATTQPKPTLSGLLKLAGILGDMPEDFALQHDHYIHGTPKR